MTKVWFMILIVTGSYGRGGIDHIPFETRRECEAAVDKAVATIKWLDVQAYCVEGVK